jgi:hypothetical protein
MGPVVAANWALSPLYSANQEAVRGTRNVPRKRVAGIHGSVVAVRQRRLEVSGERPAGRHCAEIRGGVGVRDSLDGVKVVPRPGWAGRILVGDGPVKRIP